MWIFRIDRVGRPWQARSGQWTPPDYLNRNCMRRSAFGPVVPLPRLRFQKNRRRERLFSPILIPQVEREA
jgi:hypothetical protein